ncbi:hypothetical protein LIER_10268 [Lithospermum erythrorhizon]|uniref:Cytochrome c biogenesis B n=1 Tax=Lithospermum erythrorhizon TaxID=34254 RepID=A0AAV3PKE2_LITER
MFSIYNSISARAYLQTFGSWGGSTLLKTMGPTLKSCVSLSIPFPESSLSTLGGGMWTMCNEMECRWCLYSTLKRFYRQLSSWCTLLLSTATFILRVSRHSTLPDISFVLRAISSFEIASSGFLLTPPYFTSPMPPPVGLLSRYSILGLYFIRGERRLQMYGRYYLLELCHRRSSYDPVISPSAISTNVSSTIFVACCGYFSIFIMRFETPNGFYYISGEPLPAGLPLA